MKAKPPKYWVLHMTDDLRAPTPRFPDKLPPFSVQLLSRSGEPTEAIGYLDLHVSELLIDGRPVPPTVVAAAKRLAVGEGVYLDEDGNVVEPF